MMQLEAQLEAQPVEDAMAENAQVKRLTEGDLPYSQLVPGPQLARAASRSRFSIESSFAASRGVMCLASATSSMRRTVSRITLETWAKDCSASASITPSRVHHHHALAPPLAT